MLGVRRFARQLHTHPAAGRDQKVIVVTGVSQGLGEALVHEFAAAGHIVSGCCRREHAVDRLSLQYPTCMFHVVDVTDKISVSKWREDVLSIHPRIDLLINNAGVAEELALPWDIPHATFDSVIDVNVKGVFNVIKQFMPAMLKQEHGNVVNISSGLGRSTNPEYSAVGLSTSEHIRNPA